MMRNKVCRLLMPALLFAALVSCKKDGHENVADIGEKTDPLAMELQLDILALEGRIESGKTSAVFDWVTPFEKATGCKVRATLLDSNDLFASKIAGGDYDLAISEDSFLPPEALQKIDFTRLRSFKNLDRRFSDNPGLRQKTALPLHWKLIRPVPPATAYVTEVESTHLLAKAKNPNCAYAWMEWTLSPKVQADLAAALDTIPVIPAACVGNELLGDDACARRMLETSIDNKSIP